MGKLIEQGIDKETTEATYEVVGSGGILGRLKNVTLQELDIVNSNKRKYTTEFWEGVLESEQTQDWIKGRRAVGGIKHPEKEFVYEDGSHLSTDLRVEKRGDKNFLVTDAEVLDIPNGRILDCYLKAGVRLGVSTRAEGELKEEEGYQVPVKDKFKYEGFDMVFTPGFSIAVLNAQKESFKKAVEGLSQDSKLRKRIYEELEKGGFSMEEKEKKVEETIQVGEVKKIIEECKNLLVSNEKLIEEKGLIEAQVRKVEEELGAKVKLLGEEDLENKGLSAVVEDLKQKVELLTKVADRLYNGIKRASEGLDRAGKDFVGLQGKNSKQKEKIGILQETVDTLLDKCKKAGIRLAESKEDLVGKVFLMEGRHFKVEKLKGENAVIVEGKIRELIPIKDIKKKIEEGIIKEQEGAVTTPEATVATPTKAPTEVSVSGTPVPESEVFDEKGPKFQVVGKTRDERVYIYHQEPNVFYAAMGKDIVKIVGDYDAVTDWVFKNRTEARIEWRGGLKKTESKEKVEVLTAIVEDSKSTGDFLTEGIMGKILR